MSVLPTILVRLGVLLIFRRPRINANLFEVLTACASIYFVATFGFWTTVQLLKMLQSGFDCANGLEFTFTRGAYLSTIILGAFPAVLSLSAIILIIAWIPMKIYELISTAHENKQKVKKAE